MATIDISKALRRRTNCPLCESERLSPGIAPHTELPYPLMPVCTADPDPLKDLKAPFTICYCLDCGLITLLDYVEPAVLYTVFHNDAVGPTWTAHYEAYAQLITAHYKLGPAGRIVEVGAGQGKLCRVLKKLCGAMEVIDPQFEGDREGVTVHPALFDSSSAQSLAGAFDAIVSSHTLEHFPEFNTYMANARTVLKPGGLLFTSVPNQEIGFAKGHGNMLSFEHPSCCTNLHWLSLHYKHGFQVKEVRLYKAHSIMIAAQKVDNPVAFTLDARQLTESLLGDYTRATTERMDKIKSLAQPDKDNWLFGAHNNAQVLFMYGLPEASFAGILDNSAFKHDKRMYGTGLTCRKPSDVVGLGARADLRAPGRAVRVFLNLGQYNDEVLAQLCELEPGVECVLL